jgi:hypothetical protein
MVAKMQQTQADTVRLAKKLLRILKEHARDAVENEVPRDVYVRAVADHAAFVYDAQKSVPN